MGQVNKLTIKMLTEQTGMRLPKTHTPKTNPKKFHETHWCVFELRRPSSGR